MYFFNSMEMMGNSQTIDQKVFLIETLKANALSRNETMRSMKCRCPMYAPFAVLGEGLTCKCAACTAARHLRDGG
jgi:hypothetical protein